MVREAGGVFSDFSGNMSGLTGDETLASNLLVYNELLKTVNAFMKEAKRN